MLIGRKHLKHLFIYHLVFWPHWSFYWHPLVLLVSTVSTVSTVSSVSTVSTWNLWQGTMLPVHCISPKKPWCSADTASCSEKTQDCEEMVKTEVRMDHFFRPFFLWTLLAEPLHWGCSISFSICTKSRDKDCRHQVARLGSKIEQSEELAKRETRQLKETTDKSMKEVTRTLATLVEQHRSKVGEKY